MCLVYENKNEKIPIDSVKNETAFMKMHGKCIKHFSVSEGIMMPDCWFESEPMKRRTS